MADMIEVRELSKAFDGFLAVDRVSFSVPEATIFGFLGPNGAGKTTTIKMLTTILRPSSGEMRLDGHDPVLEQRAARRSFGIVFQDPSLDGELTALENMELHGVLYGVPSGERRVRIDELLKFVELRDRGEDLVRHFSGGMMRRLEIARALLHRPKILFLDEPTAGLDPQTRNRIWSFIKFLSGERKTTVLFTTHYMEEADRVADELAVIDHGRIVARGKPSALKEMTRSRSLEDAFIALTGHTIREEEASPVDHMRAMGRLWGR